MVRPRFTPSAGFLNTLAVLLALLHATLAVTATTEKSMTADEVAHLTAGVAYNTRGDYRLQPENGNLPQRWVALPLMAAHAKLPSTSLPTWQRSDVWNYGHTFFFGSPVPADEWLFAGRVMTALFSAATGLLIFFWSRALFGWRGAFLSLGLFAFCPAFLAHGALATSDVAMTFFFLAGVGAWWRHLEHPGAAGAARSALIFGLACVTKVSAVLLAPMFGLIALAWITGQNRTGGWRPPLWRIARSTLVHAAVAWGIIWIFYGFRFSTFAPELARGAAFYRGDWNWIFTGLTWEKTIVATLRDLHALPEAFLYGFTFVVQFSKARGAFLNGETSISGWPSFFPYAFLVKTTLGFLLLLLAGAIAGGRAGWKTWRTEGSAAVWARLRSFVPLIALFAVYWATSLVSHLNIGHRHILPTYPVLFIAVGAFGPWLVLRRPAILILVAALTIWHVAESCLSRPHYLAYFNVIAGGRDNAWRHLVDSSLDWGQDLPGLKTWLDANAQGERAFVSYFGSGDLAHEGIRATRLPTLPEVGEARPWYGLDAGVYAISATMLQQVYSRVNGAWTLDFEKEFQALRPLEPLLLAFQSDRVRRAELLREAPAGNWSAAWTRYEELRFARLCHYLRVRPVDTNIGGSILVYRLTAAEIKAAAGGSLVEWTTLIERTVEAH